MRGDGRTSVNGRIGPIRGEIREPAESLGYFGGSFQNETRSWSGKGVAAVPREGFDHGGEQVAGITGGSSERGRRPLPRIRGIETSPPAGDPGVRWGRVADPFPASGGLRPLAMLSTTGPVADLSRRPLPRIRGIETPPPSSCRWRYRGVADPFPASGGLRLVVAVGVQVAGVTLSQTPSPHQGD